ncbi:hypothetical protein [Bacillus wiedmannii]|uniref:hypothetical protein n=1 Tax=Bacillus wiedmannii TaxID=1890302 RepID=UPI001D0E31A1|nr:hypothetical protein [Bacillus wiedmannii]MCC2327159.1 hypothetical protein [Bacillus wiedmannii]
MKVQEKLDMSDSVGIFYSENLEGELKDKLNVLVEKIEKFIKDKALKEGTVINNSVYKSVIPFSYKSRVKSQLSIEEKIIRNDIDIKSISEQSLLSCFDDLIGITILTTTIGFQDIAFKYLKDFFKANEGIITVISGLENKKSIFNNDRIQYYHIKLKYFDYPVEIQIKSVFLSAFADIEHTLFYKDHGIHELKNYNKKIMHSLAPMLINIEEILHDIYTYDISYMESEMLKTKIYTYIDVKKNDIFGVTNDKGKLSFIINQTAQILCSYFIEKNMDFDESIFNEEMDTCKDIKIINHFYKDYLPFNAISKILNDESNFLKTFLLFDLKLDEKYKEKIEVISDKIDIFFEGMLNISDSEIFKNLELKKNIQLKELYQYFEIEQENFIERFQDYFEEESLQEELKKLVNSSIIISNAISNKELLTSDVSKKIEKWFSTQEDENNISYELSENISNYILEGWNK